MSFLCIVQQSGGVPVMALWGEETLPFYIYSKKKYEEFY